MDILKSFIFGLVSGISEYMPVSSLGHQELMRQLLGLSSENPILDLFTHVGVLMAAVYLSWNTLEGYRMEYYASGARSRRRYSNPKRTYELRLLITALIPMLLILLFSFWGRSTANHSLLVCLFFILNGIMMYLPDYLRQSNKDASYMSGFDGLLLGLASGLRILPGFSGLGMGLSVTVMRGADKAEAFNWSMILTIPALLLLCILDIVGIFTAAGLAISLMNFIGYFLAAVGAFVGAYGAILLMRFLIINTGFSGYALYCWGIAMLMFILFLIS